MREMMPGKAYGRSEMYQEKTERLLFLKVAWRAWYVSTTTFWLDWLSPSNPPGRHGRM